ncbi:MAG: glutathione S-transferase N-terminal domain-containing protein [Candidatus Diapherotrites archaeon]|nr:glutathione S-transferase N-terminal domain-containing protein [Candidatus Diapherotrites archaeon]
MPKVMVYSTPICPFCIKAKQFLKQNSIKFEDIDVSMDTAKGREMVQKSGQTGVPVIDIDGKIVIGYDVARLKSLLNIK